MAGRRSRVVRVACGAYVLLVLLVLVVIALTAVWVGTNTEFGRERVRRYALGALGGATHGIVKHTMPSDTWQIIFSVIGSLAVGITAFVRVAGMAAATGPSGRGLART